jgi:hypothetical protein
MGIEHESSQDRSFGAPARRWTVQDCAKTEPPDEGGRARISGIRSRECRIERDGFLIQRQCRAQAIGVKLVMSLSRLQILIVCIDARRRFAVELSLFGIRSGDDVVPRPNRNSRS